MLIDICEEHFENYEIICVNDGSTDRSVDEIQEATKESGKTPIVSIINLS